MAILYYLCIGILWILVYNIFFLNMPRFNMRTSEKVLKRTEVEAKEFEETTKIKITDDDGNVKKTGYMISMILNVLLWPIAIPFIIWWVRDIIKSED